MKKTTLIKALPEKVQTLGFEKKQGEKYAGYKSQMQSKSDLEHFQDLSPEKAELKLMKRNSSILNEDDVEAIYKEANSMLN